MVPVSSQKQNLAEGGADLYLPDIVPAHFIYIEFSEDLKQRILSHNKGENKSTKAYLPLELIHYEAYRNKKDAKRREKYLKGNRGRTTLMTMLKECFSMSQV